MLSSLPTFVRRPLLDPATASASDLAAALGGCPDAWTVTTSHIPATDTEGTRIGASLHYPEAFTRCGYDHSMGAQANHLSAALEVLARQEIGGVALLAVEDIEGGWRFTFGPVGLD